MERAALAKGGSSSASSDPDGSRPAAEFVQSQDDPAPSGDDCPDHQEGGSGGSSGTDGTSSSDF